MRLVLLAPALLLAAIGSAGAVATTANDWHLDRQNLVVRAGVTDGMTGSQAITVQGDAGIGGWPGSVMHPLATYFSLPAWRGQRIRVTVPVKTEGDMRAYVRFQFDAAGAPAAESMVQKQDSHAWQNHSFVVDVPRKDVSRMHILVGLLGKGAVWVDAVAIEAVGKEVALSNTRRLGTWSSDWGNNLPISGDYNGGYTPPVSAPSPAGTTHIP